jgi:hypothetical protein
LAADLAQIVATRGRSGGKRDENTDRERWRLRQNLLAAAHDPAAAMA